MSVLREALPLQKPYAPLLTPFQIERAKLHREIGCAAENVRLIVLCAPAGFGKTTAMLQHAARLKASGVATAWLTLEATHNDVSHFISQLSAVLEGAMTEGCHGSSEAGIVEVIERLAASHEPLTLFLDDFETIQNAIVFEVIRQLIDHMPPEWRMVIGSRIPPDLRLGRLRARGELIEIDARLLRFSPDEAREFLVGQRKLVLSNALLERLQQITEGWATALWLASMALERNPEPEKFLKTFSGTDAAIAEFLAEEVLDRQPAVLRDFLLRTSILDQMSADVCDAVLEQRNGAELLTQLSRGNLFLVSSDESGCYRYHSLFGDFLRAQLMQRFPQEVPGLHQCAARWYEAQGRPVPAIKHALRGNDQAFAIQLLLEHAQKLLDSGRFRLLARCLGVLPADLLDTQPRLRVAQAWAHAFTRRHRQAQLLLSRLETLRQQHAELWDEEVEASITALGPILQMFQDEPGAMAKAVEAHARLERSGLPYSVLTNTLVFAYAASNRYDEARELLASARRSHREIGSRFAMVFAECLEGSISLRQGRLQDALTRFRGAINYMASEGERRADRDALASVQLAEALYEAGQLAQAEQLLVVSLPLARETGFVDIELRGYFTLVRVAWLRGEHERAFSLLGEMERYGHQDNMGRLIMGADVERTRLELLRGDVKAAALSLEKAEATFERYMWSDETPRLHDVESFATARLRLRLRGGLKDAGGLDLLVVDLQKALEHAQSQQCHRLALHLELFLIEAFHRLGQTQRAAAQMAEVLLAVAPQGFITAFVDEGLLIAELTFACLQSRALRTRLQTINPGFAERLETACRATGADAEHPVTLPVQAATPHSMTFIVEGGFTKREVDVLKLLALGKSNVQIANSLFVSENTVRTHMRNILGKLGATNRTEAVVMAQQQGLIA